MHVAPALTRKLLIFHYLLAVPSVGIVAAYVRPFEEFERLLKQGEEGNV
jgi:hypothetical protein